MSNNVFDRTQYRALDSKCFKDFDETAGGKRAAPLLARYGISTRTHLLHVYREVMLWIPALLPGECYTTESLMHPDKWLAWGKAPRRTAGMCLSYLVQQHCLPLELISKKKQYPLLFRYCGPAADITPPK